MKNIFAFWLFIVCQGHAIAQKIIEQYAPQTDSLRIGVKKEDLLPGNEKGYTLILPGDRPAGDIAGVVISLEDKHVNLRSNLAAQIYPEATARHYAVLYVSTGIPLDLFFSPKSLAYVDTTLKTLFTKYGLPNKNIFFLGVNLSGHRVLKSLNTLKRADLNLSPTQKV